MKLSIRVGWLAVLNLGIGVITILEGPGRTASSGFTVAKKFMPMHAWGWMILGFGIVLFAMQSTFTRWRQRELRIAVVLVGFCGWFFWGMCSLLNAISYGTSFRGAFLYGMFWSVHMMVAWWGE